MIRYKGTLNKILNFGNPFFKTLKDKTIGNLLDKINITDEQVFKTIRWIQIHNYCALSNSILYQRISHNFLGITRRTNEVR